MSETKQPERPWWLDDPWRGTHLFAQNRGRFTWKELEKYKDRFVAWYPDGSGIHDSDPDSIVLWERIKASGDDPAWYLIEYITDETYI